MNFLLFHIITLNQNISQKGNLLKAIKYKNGQKLIITWLITLFSHFWVNKMQAIIVLRLGFTFQSSLMLIAFLCIMTFFKSSVLTKKWIFVSIILSKYLNLGNMQLSKCLFCTSSQATFVISLQSPKKKLRRLKKQLL